MTRAARPRQSQKEIGQVVEFPNSIGLPTTVTQGATGFLHGVRIESGRLLVDPTCRVSDLLHEAGHVAIFPSAYRQWVSGDVGKAQRALLDDIMRKGLHPDDPLYRAAIQTTDAEATAWAWAAGIHLGLSPAKIIRAQEYDGTGRSQRLALSLGRHFGVHGLAHAGFCAVNLMVAEHRGVPAFPKLAMWLQA